MSRETGARGGPPPTPNQERTMKFMLISYATKDWEAGLPPDPRLLAAIPRFSEDMPEGASLVGTGGLDPSSLGTEGSAVNIFGSAVYPAKKRTRPGGRASGLVRAS